MNSFYIDSANINSFLHLRHEWHSLASPFFFFSYQGSPSTLRWLGSLYDFPPSLSLLEVPCLRVWPSSTASPAHSCPPQRAVKAALFSLSLLMGPLEFPKPSQASLPLRYSPLTPHSSLNITLVPLMTAGGVLKTG